VRNGQAKSELTGMKMKARNQADGNWFWVIVGMMKSHGSSGLCGSRLAIAKQQPESH
jgi:hypothetical protein